MWADRNDEVKILVESASHDARNQLCTRSSEARRLSTHPYLRNYLRIRLAEGLLTPRCLTITRTSKPSKSFQQLSNEHVLRAPFSKEVIYIDIGRYRNHNCYYIYNYYIYRSLSKSQTYRIGKIFIYENSCKIRISGYYSDIRMVVSADPTSN